MKKRLVEIHWHDIVEEAGWVDDDDHDILHSLKTYGIYIGTFKERKTGIPIVVIANTYDPELKKWGGRNKIPKGCIMSMTTICTIDA